MSALHRVCSLAFTLLSFSASSANVEGFPIPGEDGKHFMTYARGPLKPGASEAAERCEQRRTEEAKLALEMLERLKSLGQLGYDDAPKQSP